jgi:hypothetical protein
MSGIYGYPTDPAQTSGTVGTSAGNAGTTITEDATTVKALNNADRGIVGDLGNFRNDISAANSTASASGTAYVLSTSSQISALADGIRLTWLPDADNTGAATLNVDTLGAKKLLFDSAVLSAGELKAGHPVDCVYDASADSAAGAWLVLNPVAAAGSFTSDDIGNDSGVTGATVTEALDQLDGDKIEAADISGKLDTTTFEARTINAGTGLTGGGDLSSNRTIDADLASQAEAETGTDNTVLMTPLRTAQAISANASGGWTVLADSASLPTGASTAVLTTSIPSGTEEIEVHVSGMGISSLTRGVVLELGDSGGYETSGYSSSYINGTTVTAGETDGFGRATGDTTNADNTNMLFALKRAIDSNLWSCRMHHSEGTTLDYAFLMGVKVLSGELTSLRLTISSQTIANGNYTLRYK